MIIARRIACISARILLNRLPVAGSRIRTELSPNTPLSGLKQIYANADVRHRGVQEGEPRRRYSSLAKPKRVTEDELTIVREAHAAGKSAGEILELFDDRHGLQHLIKKAIGSRHAQRDLIRRRTPTVSGRWFNAEQEVLARGISEGKTYWRIAEELGRSQRSVGSRVERGIQDGYNSRPWSAEDDSMLRTLSPRANQ